MKEKILVQTNAKGDDPTEGDMRVRDTGTAYRLEKFYFDPLEGEVWLMQEEFELTHAGEIEARNALLK